MNHRNTHRRIPLLLAIFLAACATPQAKPPGDAHLTRGAAPLPDAGIPSPVRQSLDLPRPKPGARTETYSVVVNNVRVHDLLFALARDAKVNVDIHPDVRGSATLNAIDQTLPQILNRLARQLDLRWEMDGANLAVMPDSPFLQTYKVDYVNMKRDTTGSIRVSGEISGGSNAAGGSAGLNGSTTKIDNTANNHFWETLVQNVKDILHETDKVLPEGSSDTIVEQTSSQNSSGGLLGQVTGAPGLGKDKDKSTSTASQLPTAQSANTSTVVRRATFREAAAVIANAETGVLSIRATARQHEKILQFLDQVLSSAKRQVLIEATIAEVELNSQYQQGVDWGRVASDGNGLFISQSAGPISGVTTVGGSTGGLLTIFGRGAASGAKYESTIKLLEVFGNVKILSSPKISVVNNQSAILKVVDNQVYFNIKADTVASANSQAVTSYTTEQKVVPVGFVMNVTPQISERDEILLNVRPSITRIQDYADDPNPSLLVRNPDTNKFERIANRIPIIRTREMESILRLQDGSIAVMGGLMEERQSNQDSGVPWFHSIPLVGGLFAQESRLAKKTELVIFLRPTVIREPGVAGGYAALREHLPDKQFFGDMPGPRYQILPQQTDDGGAKP